MNIDRVVAVLNFFSQLSGYQVHGYDRKTRRFRLSLWGVAYFIQIAILYAISFNQHFEYSAFLTLLKNVSPFLMKVTHLQLFIGLKTMLFTVYEMRAITNAANGLLEVLPKIYAKRFSKDEAFAYFLIYSTFMIACGFGIYIAIEMQFKLPPLGDIMVGLALFIPHFLLASSLKFLNVGSWLLCEAVRIFSEEFTSIMELNQITPEEINKETEEEEIEKKVIDIEMGAVPIEVPANHAIGLPELGQDLEEPLNKTLVQIKKLSDAQQCFSETLQKQLSLLYTLNSNCIFAGVYSLVYFNTTWYVIFSERSQRIIRVSNYGIFVYIFWDYLCLCLVNSIYEKRVMKFSSKVLQTLKLKTKFTKGTKTHMKDLRSCLEEQLKFKLLGIFNLNAVNFVLLQMFHGIVIALIVIYFYLNDKIALLNSRLDDSMED